MAKSDLLRVQDVRAAYRLIGECRDLGSDPGLWHRRMLEGACQLFGVPVAAGGEGRWIRPHRAIEVFSAFEAGLDAGGRKLYVAYHRELGACGDPIFQALQHVPGRLLTRSRKQLVPDAVWYRSAAWEYRRPIGIDEQLTSVYQISEGGAISGIALHRPARERGFSPREQRLVSFFHEELGRLIGNALVSATEPSPERLSPRLRQTLACLLEGDSEKQVATRLGLSHATTHQYITALYRHFGVSSRGQLLAHMLKRAGRDGRRQLGLSEDEEPHQPSNATL
jgi:DNA-binding CsgD family transcriptional regulator